MLDKDEHESISAKLKNVADTISNQGMKALHDRMAGSVQLLYSEAQRADHLSLMRELKSDVHDSNKAGAVTAMDITTGSVVRFTDIEVVQGDVGSINYRLRPLDMSRTFRPHLDNKIYTDVEKVAEIDPRNLLNLYTMQGSSVFTAFEDPNPRNGSMVVNYGRETALKIVEMLKNLPDDIRPEGIYNGVNGYDSFDTVLDLGKTPNALGGRRHLQRSRGDGPYLSPPP